MKFLLVLSCVLAVALAKPGYLHSAAIILPGAPVKYFSNILFFLLQIIF